jgi:hypothetical protein
MTALAAELLAQAQRLQPILDQIAEAKSALHSELMEDRPNEKTVLAIRGRIRDLDRAAASRIVIR